LTGVTVLFASHDRCLEHLAGARHPERPDRLRAVCRGARDDVLDGAVTPLEVQPASDDDLARVHPRAYLDSLAQHSEAGGGWLDADTCMSSTSFEVARFAAGAGLCAIRALREGRGDAAFCAIRPPGHHALSDEAMGFCLLSNVAVSAAALADAGERVMVFDYDAHHGNGTQAIFYDDPRVLFVSMHQWPLYPGTGAADDTGSGAGEGFTVNLPFPRSTTGEAYLRAFDEVVVPVAERFAPTWLIISAGFDAHRDDPLAELALSAGDFAVLTERAKTLVPVGRTIAVLEGGYDLDALQRSTRGVLAALAGGDDRPEPLTNGGPGSDVVERARSRWVYGDLG